MSSDNERGEIEDIGCLEAINWLYAYLDGELKDPVSIAQIEHHLGHCRVCYSRIELERALTERLKQSAKQRTPGHLRSRVLELLEKL